MKFKSKLKNIIASLMAVTMLIGTLPTISFAAQINEYVDPADTWITSNGRSNELDFNAKRVKAALCLRYIFQFRIFISSIKLQCCYPGRFIG